VSGEFGMQSAENMSDKQTGIKYKQLVEKLLDDAAAATDPTVARQAIDSLRVLGDGITYNAVLRSLEDRHCD
jgi:hypothetical protein